MKNGPLLEASPEQLVGIAIQNPSKNDAKTDSKNAPNEVNTRVRETLQEMWFRHTMYYVSATQKHHVCRPEISHFHVFIQFRVYNLSKKGES